MRLVATNGPRAGTAFSLADGLTIGGIDAGTAGDRPCCRIRASEDGGFVLSVLDRRSQVFVNGLPVATRALEPRDELRIGDSLFVVRPDDAAAPPALAPCPVRMRRSPAPAVLELQFEDALLHADTGVDTREGRDLATLLRVGAALSAIQGLAAIDAALAGLLLEAVPVQRVVIAGIDGAAPAVQSAWSTHASPEPVAVDPSVLERVVKERVAMVIDLQDRQAVAVPLVAFGRAVGSVWAETAGGGRIDERHVRMLLVIAALAAVARENARETTRLQATNELLQAEINLDHNMVGRSRPMRTLFERIARVARTDSTLLLRGESGTGKELVARAAHRSSGRADRPFVAINCAALTESLLESELFGHEKGAFTGAIGLKRGKLELADGGTLFLDEIGELPLTLQAKLLRALQEREFERVGGTRAVRVDFRLIAATNRDLESAVKAGTFRQDLFYRLNVVTLALPPLRERKEDVQLLTEYFVRKHAPRCGRRVHGLTADALARLRRHDWPGNVRELENVIEQALALGTSDCIDAEDLPPDLGDSRASASTSLDYHEAIEQTKRDLIVRAFEQADHSHAGAARLLNVHPNYLHRLLRNLDLRRRAGSPPRPARR
jgi:Nif-specific regulatory protein